MDLSTAEIVIYSVASFVMSVLSGMAGAGGGFIMTPLLVFIGLSPAQAVATGKISGLAVTLGSLHGLREHRVKNKKLVYVVMGMAFVIGLLAPLAITNLDTELYRRLLGFIMLLMVPVLLLHKPGKPEGQPNKYIRGAGFAALFLALALQAVFSGGLGTLVNIALITLLGLSPLDANVTKRLSQLLLNVVIVIGVLSSGLIVWSIAAIGVFTCAIGGWIGSKVAIRRGDEFVRRILVVLVIIAAVELLFG